MVIDIFNVYPTELYEYNISVSNIFLFITLLWDYKLNY